MKRIVIICEGETEREFCQTVLYPHFLSKNCLIQAPLIKKSGGGIVKWSILKKEIETILKNDKTAALTTFIDFYGLTEKHEFPKWSDSVKIVDKTDRINFLRGGHNLKAIFTLYARFARVKEGEVVPFSAKPKNEPPLLPFARAKRAKKVLKS